MKRFIFILLLVATSSLQSIVFGQNPDDDQIRLKIDANVDGKSVNIDTSIENLSDFDINGFLEELGLDNELKQLNIDINSGFGYNFNWNEQAFQEMMEGLQDIELPSLPPMPPMPELEGLNFSFNKALLGVYTDKAPEGAKITSLVENSGAVEAGLAEGDIITKIDDRTIESPDNLSEVIGMYEAGAVVKVTYIRNGNTQTVNATLGENEMTRDFNFEFPDSFNIEFDGKDMEDLIHIQSPSRGYLGVYLQDEENKVMVTGVDDQSAAFDAGLKEGDIITEINGNKMETYDDIMEFMETTKPGDKISISFERDGKKEKTEATLKEVKNQMFYFKSDDKEDGYAPNIIIDKIMPCPPGSSYSYNSNDGKKNVTICITAIKDSESKAPSPKEPASKETHALLNPENLMVYSNPSEGTFNVKFNLNTTGDTKISITDINGKEVYAETLNNFSGAYDKTISLSAQPKGTYFVKVTQNGYSNTKTVVVQ
ncbi:MAG: PDZ domain-containing protein [Chitinophagales bacterium]